MVAEKLHDVNSAANVLGVAPITVRRLIDRGEIRGIKVGRSLRIADTDLQQYIDNLKASSDTARK